MRPLTIKDIFEETKRLILNGQGDKVVMLSNDDEGNGYHYCWYSFTTANELEVEDYMIDDSIASKDDTIVLG